MDDSRRSVMDALDRISDKLDVVENEQVRMGGRLGRLEESIYGERNQFKPAEPVQHMEEYAPEPPKVSFAPTMQPQDDVVVVHPPLKTSSWLHKGPRIADMSSKPPSDPEMRSTYQSDYTGRYDYRRSVATSSSGAKFTVPMSMRMPSTRYDPPEPTLPME